MPRRHNEYFRTVSLGGRKSCPNCGEKLDAGEKIWSWGEYVRGKWRTVRHLCKKCWKPTERALFSHKMQCGCEFNLVGYQGEKLPE